MNKEAKELFYGLAIALEPENLYMDGECSKAEAQRRYNRIMRKWRELEKQVGRKVSITEAFAFRKEIYG
jgi:hypothetical protein